MLENVLPSNQAQIERVSDYIMEMGIDRVGMYGLAFKPGTDDLRESPYVKLASRLQQNGMKVNCVDPMVQVSRLVGHNRQYVQDVLPELPEMVVDSVESLARCQCIVLAHPIESHQIESWLKSGKEVIDLTISDREIEHDNYNTVTK